MSESAKGAEAAPARGVMTRNQAVFIGVGAMVGAGIFALLGEAGTIAQSAVWLSFLLAGIIAALQGYSFARLGKKYASPAGLLGYLGAGFGEDSRVASMFAWIVWASAMIVVALVAVSFGSYASAVVTGGDMPVTLGKLFATLIIAGVVVLIALGGAGGVAKIQALVIRLVIIVLLALAVITMVTADWSLLAPSTYPPLRAIIGSIALTFFAFLGFGVISYTAKDLKNEKDLGPATYIALAVATITYVVIALGVFGQLTPAEVTKAGPTAIALAAKPVLGQAGYIIVAITAMLSTAGAVNSSMYPVPNLLGSLAEQGIMPPLLGAKKGQFPVGLLLTGGIILILVWFFNLSAIASLGSAVALLIFLAISFGHLRIRHETGASGVVLWIGAITVIVTLIGFIGTTLKDSPASLFAFIGLAVLALIFDLWWRAVKKRREVASTSVD